MADTVAKIVAVVRRAWGRETGRQYKPGEGIRVRAAQADFDICQAPGSLAFRSRLLMLRNECDLFYEEFATDEVVLRLQSRILELAEHNETAKEIAKDMLSLPPVAALFAAVLAESHKDGATEVRYELLPGDDQIKCSFRSGGEWTEAMTIPKELWPPIFGFATRLEHVGYDRIKPHLRFHATFPTNVTVVELQFDSFRLTLS